jgi:hypothetical protein
LWWVAASLWGLWSCLFVENITLVERRKVFERDTTCCGNSPLQAPQRRRSRSLVGGELWETNPCISLWLASLSCFLAYLICFRFDQLGCATCVCYFITLPVIICQGYSPCLVRARSKRSLKLFLQVLCATPVWPVPPMKLSTGQVWPVTTTVLTSGYWQLKFSGMKS